MKKSKIIFQKDLVPHLVISLL